MFLGQALPRFEAVVWAARSLQDMSTPSRLPNEVQALTSTLLWIQDPSENRRRAAFDAAELAATTSPERLCAMAAFYSGGSITDETAQPTPAPKDLTGRLSSGAVLIASARSADAAALDKALRLGEALASGNDV